jgi:hypothetical protein
VFASTRRAEEVLGFAASVDFEAGVAAFAHDPLRDRPGPAAGSAPP